MKDKSNFERAMQLTESWPAWKREYQITEQAETRQERSVLSQLNSSHPLQTDAALPKSINRGTNKKG
jgi:hypothetical protein